MNRLLNWLKRDKKVATKAVAQKQAAPVAKPKGKLIRAERATKKGAQKGAFGVRKPWDMSQPLKPKAMRERYADVTEMLAARRKWRRKMAKKGVAA